MLMVAMWSQTAISPNRLATRLRLVPLQLQRAADFPSLASDRDRLLSLQAGVEDRLRDAQALIPIDLPELR